MNFLLAGLSMVVKRALRHPRPRATCELLGNCHKWGMPSSHSQVMGFAVSMALQYHFHRRSLRRGHGQNSRQSYPLEVFELSALCALACGVACGRVYLGYHSTLQVVAGLILGVMHALVWFALLHMLDQRGWLRRLAAVLNIVGPAAGSHFSSSYGNAHVKVASGDKLE